MNFLLVGIQLQDDPSVVGSRIRPRILGVYRAHENNTVFVSVRFRANPFGSTRAASRRFPFAMGGRRCVLLRCSGRRGRGPYMAKEIGKIFCSRGARRQQETAVRGTKGGRTRVEIGFELGSFGFVSGCSVRAVFFVTSFERRICKIGNWVRSAIFFSRRSACHFGEVDRARARVVTLLLSFVHINNPHGKGSGSLCLSCNGFRKG
jgi:hypothetical protein